MRWIKRRLYLQAFSAFFYRLRSYQDLLRLTIDMTDNLTGTSTSTPTNVTSAAQYSLSQYRDASPLSWFPNLMKIRNLLT